MWFVSVSAVSLVVAAARLGVSVTYSLRTIAHPHTLSTPPQPRTVSLFLSFCRFVSSRFYFWHSSKKLVSLPILICQGIDDDGIMTTYCCGLLFYMYPPIHYPEPHVPS